MESYTVEAILSASDKGFTSTVNGAKKSLDGLDSKYEGAFQDKNGRWRAANGRFLTLQQQNEMLGKSLDNTRGKAEKANVSIGSIIKGIGAYKLINAAINTVKSSLGGAIERYDKLSQFPKVLEGLGASTKDAASATSKLKDGIDGLPTTLQDVASTTQQMYSVFKDADKAADSTLALNNAMLASGSTGEKAARGTEQYMKILRTGKVDMDSFTTLQETMGVGLDKVAAKFGKTGASAQSDLYKALQSGEISIDQFNQALIDLQDGLGGTAELAKKNTEGIGTSFTNMRNAVKNGMASAIETIDKALQDQGFGGIAGVLDNVKKAISQAFVALNGALPGIIDKVAKAIKYFGENAEWITPILIGLASAIGSLMVINTVMSAISSVTAAITFLTSPIGLVVAAIGLLVTAGILLYKNWDTIKAGAIALWSIITSTIGTAVDWIAEKFNEFIMVSTIIWNAIKAPFIAFGSFVSAIFNGVVSIISGVWEVIKSIVLGAVLIVIDLVTGNFSKLKDDIALIFNSIKDGLASIWNGIKTIISGVVKFVVSIIKAVWGGLVSIVSGIFNAVVNGAIGIWNGFVQKVSDIIDAVVHVFDVLSDIDLVEIGKAIIGGLVKGLKSAWEAGKNFIGGIGNWIREHKGPISYDKKLLIPAGNAIIDGLNRGLEQKFKDVKSTVNSMTDYFANTSLGATLAVDTNYGNLQSSLSNANMSLSSNNELTLNESKRPANIQLNLGNRAYSGFVADISSEMAIQVDLNQQT